VIGDADVLGKAAYTIADGTTRETESFVIRDLEVNGIRLRYVAASTVPKGAPTLLGLSALEKFRSWGLDNETNDLMLVW
jgi:predicted aspartyl protease